jgi:hypothetical protein
VLAKYFMDCINPMVRFLARQKRIEGSADPGTPAQIAKAAECGCSGCRAPEELVEAGLLVEEAGC